MGWRGVWVGILLCGCELLEPAPHDTGPIYANGTPSQPASSSGGGISSSSSRVSSSRHSNLSRALASSSYEVAAVSSSSSAATSTCAPGGLACSGTTVIRCDADGGQPEVDCHDTGQACAPGLGCTVCVPGTGSCVGIEGTGCRDDGTGYDTVRCDTLQGQTCNADTGRCRGACASTTLGRSYIGCDYFPTVTTNLVDPVFHFAVAVSNTTSTAATLTVTQGPTTVQVVPVGPHSVAVVRLPWQDELKGDTLSVFSSTKVARGAYRLRSTQPVTVYQFNPLEYQDNGNFSYSNDASLLLPTSAWTTSYLVASLQSQTARGFYAVTAHQDNTVVNLAPGPQSGEVTPGNTGVPISGIGQVTLNAGDVLEMASGDAMDSDLTGTRINADKPVQVLAGHQCANVPDETCCCDHLEESMFPLETLSKDYVVTAPLVPTLGDAKIERVRIVATQSNTSLLYDPPQPGAPGNIALAGGWVELRDTSEDFLVRASKPVMVMQYMEGQLAGGDTGDPAMALVVGVQQHRGSYLFHAPTNYEINYANLVVETGRGVRMDSVDIPLALFVPIGNSGYSVARVMLSNGGNGDHFASSSGPFGVSVYGYGQYTSYWYPGGGNLRDLLH